MSAFLSKVNSFSKDFLIASRAGLLLRPFYKFMRFASNFALLDKWVQQRRKESSFTDFYKPRRTYSDREKLYRHVSEKYDLAGRPVHYLEFGVASAHSFRWWLAENKNPASFFYGFDTFEGLPEDYGRFYTKGSLSYSLPDISDPRAKFFKGLFQDTVLPFLEGYGDDGSVIRVLHMDADLYSATLFALTMLAPYLRPGDLIFFDEFNVPTHEFMAWDAFIKSYYFEYEVVGSVNNFYQTCFRLTKTLRQGG